MEIIQILFIIAFLLPFTIWTALKFLRYKQKLDDISYRLVRNIMLIICLIPIIILAVLMAIL